MKKDQLTKQILADCRKAIGSAVGIYSIENIFQGLLAVYTANVLSLFADAVFALDLSFGLANFWKLLLCIGLNVFALPLIATWGEVNLFANTLKHDRKVFSRFLDKSYDAMLKLDEGEIQYHLEADCTDFRIVWLNLWVNGIAIPFTLGYLLYSALQISALYTILVLAISIINLAVPVKVKKLKALYDRQKREYEEDVRSLETELSTKPYAVKLYGLQEALIRKFEGLYQQYFNRVFTKSVKYNTAAEGLAAFISKLSIFIILLAGAVLVAMGQITPGAVAAMVGYFAVFNSLIDHASYIIQNKPVLNNLIKRVALLYDGVEKQEGVQLEEVNEITAKNLSFAWEENKKQVFENLSFDIRKGTKTVITGPNGSGKSTLLKILCGLHKNYTGQLRINRHELSEIRMDNWRKQFAYISQDPYLFEGTVRENVALGNLNADEEAVTQAMRQVGILDLAERKISMSQKELSGGQRQRISIARAIVKGSPILLMDEPSNYLDEVARRWLEEWIETTPQTVVYISHEENLIKEGREVIRLQFSGEIASGR